MKENNNIKLYVYSAVYFVYFILFILISTSIFVTLFLLLPLTGIVDQVIAICIYSFVVLIPILGLIVCYQPLYINEEKIVFKILCFTRITIEWKDISKVCIQERRTWYSWVKSYNKKWIAFIKKDKSNNECMLTCSPKNIQTIINVCNKYGREVEVSDLQEYAKNMKR